MDEQKDGQWIKTTKDVHYGAAREENKTHNISNTTETDAYQKSSRQASIKTDQHNSKTKRTGWTGRKSKTNHMKGN